VLFETTAVSKIHIVNTKMHNNFGHKTSMCQTFQTHSHSR